MEQSLHNIVPSIDTVHTQTQEYTSTCIGSTDEEEREREEKEKRKRKGGGEGERERSRVSVSIYWYLCSTTCKITSSMSRVGWFSEEKVTLTQASSVATSITLSYPASTSIVSFGLVP